ncbi:nicotinate phosphoribosyltransferase [Labedella endophytica]|uniref:Nicotinate phosphoribosyltransferase n=1 Tax=Labedella endophytica TaxID=1523160 RepID=A0A433JNL0_9MICO|nr:nicotinate phosphoribosyltransferase [Labedella endophytica]RUQ97663.1 nicotinate phosphoribosyltransferase [Labedella endophytica]
MSDSTALHTDRYELTMVDAAIANGTAYRDAVFETFARRLPGARRYGVVAGTGRLVEAIMRFRFHDEELTWLAEAGVVRPATIDWLADYRFSGSVWGYREGEVYFPGSPVLVVESSFAEGVVLETLALSVLNYDSAVANAATRMVTAAGGRPLAEMGSRRAHEGAAVAAARAAFIAGFGATSNLEAGRTWGIPTMGTAAHAFTLLHDSEEDAFRAQVDALGAGTTLLVDTYDIPTAIDTAVRVAGPGLGAVRLDSGDLPTLVVEVREQLDRLGAHDTRITVTNDLDEYSIAGLSGSPVDSYGVGTSLVTGSGSPAAGMVYKLVAHRNDDGEWVSVAKASVDKVSLGGRKRAYRRFGPNGLAVSEIVRTSPAGSVQADERELLTPLLDGGEPVEGVMGAAGVTAARSHREKAVAELPAEAFRLTRGEPALPTIYE